MAVQLGKRYGIYRDTGKVDDKGEPILETIVELLCIRPGAGTCELGYSSEPMELVAPKVLPSAD